MELTIAQKERDLESQGFSVKPPEEPSFCYRLLFREWGAPRELGSTDYAAAISEAWDGINRILNERARLSIDKTRGFPNCNSNAKSKCP